MARAKIIRVFGKADDFDIELSRKGKKWEVDIPPDMTDGVYAVQLTAIDENGENAYWVGELYMTNGVCCLTINELPYRVRFRKNEYEADFSFEKYKASCRSSFFDADFKKKHSVQFRKKTQSKSNYEVIFSTNLKTSEAATHCIVTIETKKAEINPKTELHTEYTPKTEIHIRKGCRHYGA